VLEAGELAKLAYYNDIVVGAVCCRVDTTGGGRKVRRSQILNFWQFCQLTWTSATRTYTTSSVADPDSDQAFQVNPYPGF
jgi:hypothetical protein